MKKVEKKIMGFAESFLRYLNVMYSNSTLVKNPEPNVLLRLNFSFRFIESWGPKTPYNKYYLTLFKNNKYIWELFLSRIIFNNNSILWYLDTPSSKINQNTYHNFFGNAQTIPPQIVEDIKEQQEKIQPLKKYYKVNDGFLIADNDTQIETHEFLLTRRLNISVMRHI